jgi:hypothetical protein
MLLLIISIFLKNDRCYWDGFVCKLCGIQEQPYDRRISFKNICLMDKRYAYIFLIQRKLYLKAPFFLLNSRSFCSFQIVKLVAWEKSLPANLIA